MDTSHDEYMVSLKETFIMSGINATSIDAYFTKRHIEGSNIENDVHN